MRLKRATSLKAYRQKDRTALGDDFGARPRRRKAPKRPPAQPRPPVQPRPPRRPQPRKDRREQRAERVQERLWSEAIALGENIRIQAADGYRGAFLELRPGLYLVAELRTDGLEGEFGRKVQVKEVTDEVMRVTDKALDSIFPGRRAHKQGGGDDTRRRADLARREQEQARREREIAEREAAARAAQARALPAPQAQLALPAPRQSALPRGTARWLDEDYDDDSGLAGCRIREEQRR